MVWQQLIVWVVTAVISSLLTPKPKAPQDAKPGEIGGKQIPIVSEDAPIPVVFGRRRISRANVVWWGDVGIEPIKKETGGKK